MAEQEYLVKGNTLTGIANAIRSKAGITEAFPLSEFASKIENISAGASVLSGTFKPTSSAIQTITHNLGKTPSGILIYYPISETTTPSKGLYFAFGTTNTQFGAMYTNSKYGFMFGTNSITSSGAITSFIANANSTTFQVAVFRTATSATTYLVSNMTYHWYVW
nr:MAG TPA: hypothetical protein [Caudoviricetes sp.]